jgi:hypothetical protein
MRKFRTSVLVGLVAMAMAGALQLAGCANTGQPQSSQGMIENRGLDYNH